MDNVMYASMDRDTHPFITYHLRKMTPSATEREPGDPLVYDTVGDLTISGITNSVTMPISVQSNGESGLKFVGKTFAKMTDFGIKPPAPRLVFGLIKTGDDVLIRFEWVVKRQRRYGGAQFDTGSRGGRLGEDHLRGGDGLPAGGVVLADEELVVTKIVCVVDQIYVALQCEGRILGRQVQGHHEECVFHLGRPSS